VTPEFGDKKSGQGTRERKQRDTRLRIAEVAMALFLKDGYDATTLDAIAEQAGISRRTFFSYFKSKEDIVLAMQSESWDAVRAELLAVSPDEAPLDAVLRVMKNHAALYESDQLLAIDRMMRASETLMARKPAAYAAQEVSLYATLCEVWRQPRRRPALRMVAMASIGAMRVALESWSSQDGRQPLSRFLDQAFASLKAEI
jgi:AcrR family transcriptional regulator